MLLCAGAALAVRHELLDDVGVTILQDSGTTQVADLLVCTLDHAVLFTSLGSAHFTSSSELKALFNARFCLHLGHFHSSQKQRLTLRITTAAHYLSRAIQRMGVYTACFLPLQAILLPSKFQAFSARSTPLFDASLTDKSLYGPTIS